MVYHEGSLPPLTESLFHVKFYRQWIGAFGVILLLLQLGGMTGWTSPYLAIMTKPGAKPIHLNLEEASWMASLLNAGRFLGAVMGMLSIEYWGTKRSLIITTAPVSLSWLLILVADGPFLLYVARISGGLGVGMGLCIFPLYIGEISLPQIRGAMITIAICGGPFGVLLASVLGHYLSMKWSSIIFLVPCVLLIGLFLWLPDTPYYLMKIGNYEAARNSIYWYRRGEQVNEEFNAVRKYVMRCYTMVMRDRLSEFRHPPIRRALFIVLMLYFYIQISGQNSIVFYMELIFSRGKSHVIKPALAVILVNIVSVLTLLLSVNLMDICGRRELLLISGLFVSLSNFALGTHFLLLDLDMQWLPVVSIFVFCSSFSLGLTPVPSAILSEMFPASIKGVAACLANIVGGISSFIVAKTFQGLCDVVGEAYVFYGYGTIVFTIVPFVFFVVPETKGKSLLQIQEELMLRRSTVSTIQINNPSSDQESS